MDGPEARTQPRRVLAVPCRQQRPVPTCLHGPSAAIFESPSRTGEEEANSLTHTLTMSDIDYTETAESLQNDLADEGVDVDVDTLEQNLRDCVETYSLDEAAAVRTVASKYTPDDESVNVTPAGAEENEHIAVADIAQRHDNAERESAWVDATVEVLSTWTIDADSVAQKAQIADDTGKAELTVWASADAPALSEGDVVALGNVPTDEYQGTYSLKVTSDSTVEFQDEDIDAVDNLEHVEGRVVQAREGIVDRCTHDDCTRVINTGNCPDHPNADTERDFRLKLTVDDGHVARDAVLQQDEAEAALDVTFEDAMDILNDTLDVDDTNEMLHKGIVGKQVSVAGPEIYGSIQAEDIVVVENTLDDLDVDAMLVEAREARPAALSE